nr:MAG TPA: hypothetical protein [Caudoviricetes sp.]DAS42409.1 MAG TPA: hypothetical protein [Caudoviricetes sp.]DAS51868.1 MAG TPA: hypothetical protein [Caudoviricetes sp.]
MWWPLAFWLAATPWPGFLRRWRSDGSNTG